MANMTLCWDCKRAAEKTCDWAREFEPVRGWVAVPERVKCGDGKYNKWSDSYKVIDCPEFERDGYGGGMYRLKDKKKYEESRARAAKKDSMTVGQ